jgi:protein SCO1/2
MKIVFSIILLIVLFSCNNSDKKVRVLPMVGNFDIVYSMVGGKEVADTVFPKMVDFAYLNQDSILIKSSDMKGKIWIADFMFTTCPTICPKMTEQMKRLSGMTKDLKDHIQFMSFSINPKYDTPSQLKKYIIAHKITTSNWYFFTGNEAKTHDLGINNFQIFAGQDASAAGGYAHTAAFALVDKEGYVRGVYMGTDPKEVNKLEKDIRKLLKYEYSVN